MFKEFSNNDKDDDYLSEFKQKIANQQQEDFLERQSELQRSRNGFIGTLAGIFLAGIVSWFLLMPKFSGNQPEEIPVIRRPIAPVKIQPNEPGGMEILNQDKSVYDLVEKKEIMPEKIESILPEPETPKMPTIVPEEETAETKDAATKAAQADTQEDNELPIKPLKEKLVPTASTSGQAIDIPEKITDIELEVKTADVKQEPVKAEVKKEAKPATSEQPKEQAQTASKPAEVKKESVKEAVKEVVKEPVKEAIKEAPKESVQQVVNEVLKESAPQSTSAIAKGVWQVQLIASSNQKAVETAWKDLSSSHSVLKGLPHEIETSETGGLYRLKAGAFATRSDADKVCNAIKKAGGSCLVKQK